MIISEYKTIFIHIPKNAGTSIETLFANKSFQIQPNKHDNIYQIKKKFPEIYNNYRKFTIIRNPYDKMVSWYFYLKRNLGENYDVIDFNEWIKNPSKFWHADDPISYLKPQHEWIDDTVEIIKFENINKEINEFFKKEINLPIVNKSNHDHYLTYYNRKSLNIVYDKYKEDFEKFNYKKITKI
tara:strand:+ start:44 stop:592 length:549 start_codon:yes stop_codon:yes gene_type:complete